MKTKPFRVPSFNAHYEGEYSEREILWRRLGAREKAENIATILRSEKIGSVLEVGCGTGSVLRAVVDLGIGSSHVGVDIADPSKHTDPEARSLDLRQYTGGELPFESKSIDFVFASHVIEHVPEPRALLSEMQRVAARFLYVEVPCELHLRTRHDSIQRSLNIGHINLYNPKSFQLLLESSGFLIDQMQLFDHCFEVHRFNRSYIRAMFRKLSRSTVLSISPLIASQVFTFHCGALSRL